MKTTSTKARKLGADSSIRQRAAQVRDATGRFTKRGSATSKTESPRQSDTALGYITRPADAHPDIYGLLVGEGGAGLKMPPGSSVLVEPVPPSGRDFCVAAFVGGTTPSIWQIGESFDPDFLRVTENSEITPMIEVFDPSDGRRGYINARKVQTLHRIQGVCTPVEVLNRFGAAPADLPFYSEAPEGCLEHAIRDATNYPILLTGDIALVDISQTDLTHGALALLKWDSGGCSILQTNYRAIGTSGLHWLVDPLNRPQGPGMMERRQQRGGLLYASDGPYPADLLQSKIIGRVVGILSRRRASRTRSAASVMVEG